nr:YqgE/AlgH family protein [Corynebacterium sp. ES2775-CONJ]
MAEAMRERIFANLERNEVYPGQVLVAAPDTDSDEANRGVILIISHDIEGTLGVLLNHRTDMAVAEVRPDWQPWVAKPQTLYHGGSTNPEMAIAVAVTKPEVDNSQISSLMRITNRIALADLGLAPESIAEYIEAVRIFVGTYFFAPGELEAEIAEGEWYVAPCLPSDVIAPGAVDLWGDIMRRQPMPLPLLATHPGLDVDEN